MCHVHGEFIFIWLLNERFGSNGFLDSPISFIRKYLTRSATEKLRYVLISALLDYGNALLFNLPQTQLSKLQKLQNAAARIITLSQNLH